MKKFGILASAALAASIALAGSASAQQITYNLWNPPSALEYKIGLVPYFDRVTEKTGGKFSAQIFTAGQMLGPIETLPGIRDGAVGGGFVFEQFFPKDIPNTYMFNETNGFNENIVAAAGASMETYFLDCPECLEEAKNAGVVMLGGHSTAPYIIMCVDEITSTDQLAGKRIRGTTAYHNAIINTYGGVGVNVAFPEIAQALERGTLDCMVGTESWITGFGIQEIVKTTISEPNFGSLPTLGFITFNRGVWDGFDPEVRQALLEEMPGYVSDITMGFIEEREAAVAAGVANGMKVADLGESYAAKHAQFLEAERPRVLEAAKARGDEDAEAFLDKYLAKYEEWKVLAEEIGTDKEKFRQLLWDRVYSKVQL